MSLLQLDTRTLLALLVTSALLMACILAPASRGEQSAGLKAWVASLLLLATGWFMLLFRGSVTPLVTVAAADTLIAWGLATQIAAFFEFQGRPAPRWIGLPLLVFFGALAFGVDQPRYTSWVGSLGMCVPLLPLAFISARWGLGPAGVPMSVLYLGTALLLVVRAWALGAVLGGHAGVFDSNDLTTSMFATNFAMTVTGSLGFLEMHRRRAAQQIERMAHTDMLTGLMNRQAFMEAAARELARARREQHPVAFLMADIDHFKRVNDTWGHLAGDRVLAAVAGAMRSAVRQQDAVGRYGGEEFCAVVSPVDLRNAVEIAERMRAAVAHLEVADIDRSRVTISVGVVLADSNAATDVAGWLQHADEAMYRAKSGGRDRVVAWQPAAPVLPQAVRPRSPVSLIQAV